LIPGQTTTVIIKGITPVSRAMMNVTLEGVECQYPDQPLCSDDVKYTKTILSNKAPTDDEKILVDTAVTHHGNTINLYWSNNEYVLEIIPTTYFKGSLYVSGNWYIKEV